MLREELRPTLALALPIVVAQVGQMLIGITDSAMIGRLGTVPLAAAAFTSGVFGVFFVAGIGLLSPVGVFTARDHGANDLAGCASWLRHGRVIALAYGFGSWGLLALIAGQLRRFGQPPEVLAITPPFFILISASLIPTLYFQVQRQFAESLGHPWVPMMIMLADVVMNAALNAIFIWGGWGVPPLGLVGAGIATLLARTLAVVTLGIWLQRSAALRDVRLASAGAWSRTAFRALLGMGIPAAGSLLFESGAFAVSTLMMGWLGATALAAHQVAISCVAFTFMFPLGLSIAVSMRASKALGAGKRDRLRPIAFGGLSVATILSLVFATTFAFAGESLARGFSHDPAVTFLTARLLLVAAFFQVFDAAQVVGSGALRGLADVRIPTVLTFIAYWVLALPTCYLLAFHTRLGPAGVWTGLAIGLCCASILLWLRFDRRSRLLSMSGQSLARFP